MASDTHVLDPVCGMLIEPSRAAGTRTHRETVYHLCSVGCMLKFDGDADAYIAATRADEYLTWRATVLTALNSAPEPPQASP
jgi:YHS domain-containing protein